VEVHPYSNVEKTPKVSWRSPKYADTHYNLAIVYANNGNYDKSVREYHTAIACNQSHADAHYNLAIILEDHFSDFQGAAEELRHAIKHTDSDYLAADAHYNLGLLLQNKFQDRAHAAQEYHNAIQRDPAHESAHHNLGLLIGS
jgi:tetratricopeptide (TPR) repeat protein